MVRTGYPAEGEAWLNSALGLDPNYAPAHAALADLYERAGDAGPGGRAPQEGHGPGGADRQRTSGPAGRIMKWCASRNCAPVGSLTEMKRNMSFAAIRLK